MKAKLTKAVVEGALPAAKRYLIRDAGDGAVKGFALKVEPSGHRAFVFIYRTRGGRRVTPSRVSIGPYSSSLTVAEARGRALELKRRVHAGEDPAQDFRVQKAQDRAQLSLTATREAGRVELVVAAYTAMLKRRARPLRALGRLEAYFRQYLIGTEQDPGPWRGRPIQDIRASDVRDILRGMVEMGRVSSIRHVLHAVSPMFDFAVAEEHIKENPARGIRPRDFGCVQAPRGRVLNRNELRAVWAAADKIGYPFGPFFKLLILTGQRRNEVAGMRLDELDLAAKVWLIPGWRTKNGEPHVVHLSALALEIIAGLPKPRGGLLFTTNGKTAISGFSRAKIILDRECHVPNWVPHDLRRTLVTACCDDLKVRHEVADKVINHRSGIIRGVAAVYQRAEFLDERRRALEDWGQHVGQIVAHAIRELITQQAAE